ncbi:hypothetical protein RIF25_00035 [Thermosynechococcaceae cyanobacterium BACA0444]|uniref:Uncharacterized protein n=1 Tax=Pseudocalidococcus azoricus BACA0444 TaxID=2918990 RepID=A0AAE4JXV4_9CYAN|nr:hypothetical protein [Pseudocalidococcus azoricus]MDS3859182.1 hypothetical protein [Pseudocalidococcus azoricus BACA0444]
MVNSGHNAVTKAAERLLLQYGFDLAGDRSQKLFDQWLRVYPPRWIRLAIIEALYQGRYKAISVEQLLAFWLRRGEAQTHFNSEFEAMICRNLPRDLTTPDLDMAEPITMLAWGKLNQNSPDITPSPERKPQNIDQFQPQAPNDLTTHFAEKLTAIAQAWKASQNPLASATLAPNSALTSLANSQEFGLGQGTPESSNILPT